MIGFGLLLAHLVGDFIVQNDWMARWKNTVKNTSEELDYVMRFDGDPKDADRWASRAALERTFFACTWHCLIYTLAVFLVLLPLVIFPWWFYLTVFAVHWPIDRYKLAYKWMVHVSYQKDFATGPLAPWSIIMVDNVFHLLTLYALALLAGVT